MDTKIDIKEEESLSDDVTSQSGTEFFPEVVTVKRECDAVLRDDECGMAVKTEIKSETPFPKLLMKTETVTCSIWEMDRKTVIEEHTLVSDFGSQKEGEFLSEDPVMKDKKYNCNHEVGKKLEIKEEHCWLDTETHPLCDYIKDEVIPPVKPSRCTEVSGTIGGKSLWIAAEGCGRDTSLYPGNNPEYEHQKSDVIEKSGAEEYDLSEQSGKCSEGGKMYIKSLHLKQKTLVHKSKRIHKCETCDKSFTRLPHLKRHYLIHEGKKSHQCKTCDRSFTQLSHLKRHCLIHEGKRPHKCKTCDKSFARLSYLKTHYLIHERKKPHQCKTCGKGFRQLSNLKTHYLTHDGKKPHQCKTCDKSFTRLSYLKTHYLIHEGKKPHQCKTCGKRFRQLSNLKTHYLTHDGKKPHQCKTCDKSFSVLSDLKTHYLIHESKK